MKLKLLSYNIRFGGVGRENAIAEVVNQVAPDLVVFQEAIDPQGIERLSKLTRMPFWAARTNHSIGYISRKKVEYHEWHYPAGARHSFLEILPAETQLRVFGLHLSARFSKWDERRRARELSSLLEGIKRYRDGFHVLVGDFNTLAPGEVLEMNKFPAWIRALIWISGRQLQSETIQLLLDAAYTDAYRSLHPETEGYTFPTWDPHVRLDYVFVPDRYADSILKCDVMDNPVELIRAASDHCPLVSELDLG